jgi:hypothetical protein
VELTSREFILAAGLSRVAAVILTVVAAGRLLIGDRILSLVLLLIVIATFTLSAVVVRRAQRHQRERTRRRWSAVGRPSASPGVPAGLAQPTK